MFEEIILYLIRPTFSSIFKNEITVSHSTVGAGDAEIFLAKLIRFD